MNAQNAPKITKETKDKIRVEFERTSKKERMRIKYLSGNFVISVVWWFFRFVILCGLAYVIQGLSCKLSEVLVAFCLRVCHGHDGVIVSSSCPCKLEVKSADPGSWHIECRYSGTPVCDIAGWCDYEYEFCIVINVKSELSAFESLGEVCSVCDNHAFKFVLSTFNASCDLSGFCCHKC